MSKLPLLLSQATILQQRVLPLTLQQFCEVHLLECQTAELRTGSQMGDEDDTEILHIEADQVTSS